MNDSMKFKDIVLRFCFFSNHYGLLFCTLPATSTGREVRNFETDLQFLILPSEADYRINDKKNNDIIFTFQTILNLAAKLITLANLCEPRRAKTCLRAYAHSEGPDQPAHPRSLIRPFTVR